MESETEKFNNLKRLPEMKCLVHFKKDLALFKKKISAEDHELKFVISHTDYSAQLFPLMTK